MDPIWIPKEVILPMHDKLLHRYGGSDGIRDEGLLESALSRPQQLFHYEQSTLFSIAASYAFGIIKNHPFIDGNKRTGFMSAYTFLAANGHRLIATEEDALRMTAGLAASVVSEQEYATWLAAMSEKI